MRSHEATDERHCLIHDFVVALADFLDHACLHMLGQKYLGDAAHGAFRSGELGEDIAAISVFVEHCFYAVELADRFIDALLDIVLKLGTSRS